MRGRGFPATRRAAALRINRNQAIVANSNPSLNRITHFYLHGATNATFQNTTYVWHRADAFKVYVVDPGWT